MNQSIYSKIKSKLDLKDVNLFDRFLKEINSQEDKVKNLNSRIDFTCVLCKRVFNCKIKDWIRSINSEKCKHYFGFYERKAKVKISILQKMPHIINEWCKDLNNLSIEEVNYSSDKKHWWRCLKCNSNYLQSALHKYKNHGCPYCAGKKVNETNSLFHVKPDIAKCVIDVDTKTISYCSSKKCKIKCIKCGEESFTKPFALCKSFSIGRTGCKFCANKIVNENNNLTKTHPELCLEWSDKNEFGPEKYTAATTRIKFWWKCKDCDYEWKAQICRRTGGAREKSNKSGCPHCSFRTSKTEHLWLDSFKIPKENRQIKIRINNKSFFVDGFDPSTNTVYEFDGDYWHGNPKIYKPEDVNKVSKKTFKELYEYTLNKKKLLEENGYNVINIWESDWKAQLKNNK